MFVLGHIGITLGSAVAVAGAVEAGKRAASRRRLQTQPVSDPADIVISSSGFSLSSWIISLARFLDLRFLLIGSLLPDIIDKPLGIFIFGEGRSISHTLLATLLMLIVGLFLSLNFKRTAVLALAFGMASHLILDFMWQRPAVFLWPLYGWKFASGPMTGYMSKWISSLTEDPVSYWTEGIGLAVIAVVVCILANKKKLLEILKSGRL